ncbi:MAG: DUF4397 domain-containing protein [Jatrophihabitans sp.]
MRRTLSLLSAAFLALATLLVLQSPSASAADTASVSVVHGIPKTPVNVFVNGKSTLANFKPGSVAGPLQLPAGSYAIKVYPASNTKGTGTPILSTTAKLSAGDNVTLVAHLTAAGKPALTAYANDTSPIPAGKSRLIVRHTAAAPAVDIRANGTVAIKGLTNPKEASAVVDAGTVSADVVLAGTSTVAIGPAKVNLAEGTDVIVYAIGSATDKTLSLVVQTISGLGSDPGGIPGGTGGQAAAGSTSGWIPVAVLAGLVMCAGGAVSLRTSRARA